MILRGEFKIEMPGKEIFPNIWGGINLDLDLTKCDVQGPVYVGSGSRIEPGATVIGPTVIGRNCLIEKGARIEACVIGDYTRITAFADVFEKIISGRFCVDRHGDNVDLNKSGYTFVIDDVRERRTWTQEQQILIDFLKTQNLATP
ncbi:MAG TPA: hypothetical protein VNJ02_18935 [Vicinamibacterales bacterium]|nr:hypothetical protein [Vicinamibacterales bacterium]